MSRLFKFSIDLDSENIRHPYISCFMFHLTLSNICFIIVKKLADIFNIAHIFLFWETFDTA